MFLTARTSASYVSPSPIAAAAILNRCRVNTQSVWTDACNAVRRRGIQWSHRTMRYLSRRKAQYSQHDGQLPSDFLGVIGGLHNDVLTCF